MSGRTKHARYPISGSPAGRVMVAVSILALFGFTRLAVAQTAKYGGAAAHRLGAASKVDHRLVANDEDPSSPSRNGTSAPRSAFGVAGPINDTCAGAIPLPLNRTVIATTALANDDYHAPATTACFAGIGQTPTTAPGRDIVFSFTAPSTGSYSVRIIPQNPNSDPTRTQNPVLYASDSCPSSGEVDCIAGANRPQSNVFTSSTGAASNTSEELACIPLTAGQTIYVFFDDAAVAGTSANPGGGTSLEAIPCVRESEPNDTIAQANAFQCGILGASTVGAVAHCYLGTRAGQACTRSTPLDESFAVSNKVCSITGVPCSVNPTTGVSTCVGGSDDLCQQQTDFDCDPRCDVGPNAGLSCTTYAFCNPGSDQGAICAGTCQVDSECLDADGASNGTPCTAVCVGGLTPGAYCSSLSGCPGAGVCTVATPSTPTDACPAGYTCSRQLNEGDADFFSLGTPAAGSKIFAVVDGKAANDYDWRMRINSATQTLQFDDDDGTYRTGSNSPVIAGALATGTETFIQVSRTSARPSETYELSAIVRPPSAQAQVESEAGPTGNDIYFGWPGDVINANYATGGGYVRGSFAVNGDSDCFKFIVNEGDLMDWYGDGNPARTAGGVGLVNIPWPIVYDANSAAISNFIFGLAPGRRNTNASTQAVGLTNTSPAVGPPGYLQWRATYTGMLEVCFYDDSAAISLGTPSHPGAWVGSLSVNCQPLRPAGPGSTETDVALTETVSAGPYLTGSFVTYTITATNSASDIAQEVRLSDTLDPNLSFISLTVDDGLGGNNTACFSLPTPGAADAPIDCINTSMAPGTSTTYVVTVQVNNCIGAGVHIPHTAAITTVSTDPDPGNDSGTSEIVTDEDGSCADLACEPNLSCVKNLCTDGDHCDAGVCVSAPVTCDDSSICTDDSCDPPVGCVFDSSQAGDLCEDFNPCTTNACDPDQFCVFPPAAAGTSCDDNQACTTSDTCDGQAVCVGQSVCNDDNACTDDLADEGNECACSHTATGGGTPCDDSNVCTDSLATPDSCDGAGTCVGGEAMVCDDNNACTNDSCDPVQGCVFAPAACDDGNACNGVETCDTATGCVAGTPLACGDGDVCNGLEVCNPASGCVAGTPLVCNDGNACNGVETCDTTTGCVAGTSLVCGDGDACNGVETCSPATGCAGGTPLACNDGNACNGAETCDPGTGCVAGAAMVCTASDPCHDVGTCNPGTGLCSNPAKPDGTTCNDGNACSTADTCAGGVCTGGPPLDCDDENVCTAADACEPASGCVTSPTNFITTGFSELRVDGLDLIVLADAWNDCPEDEGFVAGANLDRVTTGPDACVGLDDFHLFMDSFGQSCPVGAQR